MRQSMIRRIIMGIILILGAMPGYALHSISEQSVHPDTSSAFKSGISLNIGMFAGSTKEYVYDFDYMLSKLDWDLQPVFFGGGMINLQFFSAIFLNVGYWAGINTDIGEIRDYDYVNYDGEVSHFSKHKCLLQKSDFFDVNLGYSLKITDNFSISALIGYLQMTIKVAAESGYYEYPPGSTQIPFYGVGISNEQVFYIPYLALGTTFLFDEKKLFVQFFVFYSPLVSCIGRDNHYRRKMEYHYKIESGHYLSFTFVFGWKINKYTSLNLSYLITNIVSAKGETYYIDLITGIQTITFYGSGAVDYNVSDIMLSIEHTFQWI